ncbi:hypothetical protein E2C01_082247 [Portunus trituberculatus]|uniref:Uncharacterized protein n=1 Tax=Portunus trituberculatus TaxID=210409 RepID=A0A5B7IXY8_PORTR|nr:hypothetical protein [Portunus trituberculatus]
MQCPPPARRADPGPGERRAGGGDGRRPVQVRVWAAHGTGQWRPGLMQRWVLHHTRPPRRPRGHHWPGTPRARTSRLAEPLGGGGGTSGTYRPPAAAHATPTPPTQPPGTRDIHDTHTQQTHALQSEGHRALPRPCPCTLQLRGGGEAMGRKRDQPSKQCLALPPCQSLLITLL